jgi:MerR family transcriptional regulator, redox-sensitive transcriptional activator SoxR
MRATHVRTARPRPTDLLTVGEIARRSGFTASAVRYYDELGLISAARTLGGQRRFQRGSLYRLALIRAARNMGLGLDEISAALPRERIPAQADSAGLPDLLRKRLDEQISALEALRDQLIGCVGCGCMAMDNCPAANPADSAGADGPGAAYLPAFLRSAGHARTARQPDHHPPDHHPPGTVNAAWPTWPVCSLRLIGATLARYFPGARPERVTLMVRAVVDSTNLTVDCST